MQLGIIIHEHYGNNSASDNHLVTYLSDFSLLAWYYVLPELALMQ